MTTYCMTRFTPCRSAPALLAIVAAMTTWCVPAAGQGSRPAVVNTPVLTIPIETMARIPIVPVSVDGSRPLRCILDTGMPEGLFIFDPAVGKELELAYVATTPVMGTGAGTRTAQVAIGATLQLEGLSFQGQNVIVLTEAGELSKMGVDGVIGAAVFNRYVTEMNFETATLSLYDPVDFDADASGASMKLTVTATKPYVETAITIDGGESIPVTLLVDSGASNGLMLFPSSTEKLELPEKSLAAVVISGVGGDVEGVFGRVSSLELGPHRLTEIVTAFPDRPQGSANGAIGMGILSRFVVTFDYVNQRMLLRPSSSFADPFEYNMTGLILRPRDGGQLSVKGVIDGSPAARRGIRHGDLIVAIDGRQLVHNDGRVARDLLRQENRSVVLTIERAGEKFDVTIKLERLI